MAVSEFLVENTLWPSPSPTRRPGMGLSSEVPGEGCGRASGPGCWLGENVGASPRYPILASCLPGKGREGASLGAPLGPRAT